MVDWAVLHCCAPSRWFLVLVSMLASVFSAGDALAQDPRYLRDQSWSTADGLPQASVHAIALTPDGFLWIATEQGLARYDGAQFTVYDRTSTPQLPSNDLCCLAVTEDGTLWVGSGDGLLALQDGRSVPIPAGPPYQGTPILELHASGQSEVAVLSGAGHFEAGLRGSRALGDSELLASHIPVVAASTPDANGWSATASEVTAREGHGISVWSSGHELPRGRVQTVFLARDHTAWIGMSSGLARLDPATRRAQIMPHFVGRSVLTVFEDREGDLWIGTETAGLHELSRTAFRTVEGTSDVGITAITSTALFGPVLGTRDGGLLRWKDGRIEPMLAAGLEPNDTILCLDSSADGTVWAGTPHGLIRIDARGVARLLTSTEGLPDDSVRSVAAISATQAWVGTAHGLAYVDGDHLRSFGPQDGLGGNLVGTLMLARESSSRNAVWAATDGGLSLVSPDKVQRTYGKAEGLSTPVVAAMTYDGAAQLWLATEDAVLWRIEGNQPRRVLELLPRRNRPQHVVSMRVVSNTLWLQTADGILSADLQRLSACVAAGCSDVARLLTPYGEAQGMPSAETLALASGGPLLRADGELWFPTRGGIAATAANVGLGPPAAPIALERVLQDDRELELSPQLELPYGRSRITFEFAGLSLRDPRAVRYRYRLDGFDRDWIEVGQRRFATYTSLPAGGYAFHVEAALEGQPWSSQQAMLALRISPPFYRRWWFILLIFACGAACLGAGYFYRLRFLRQRFAVTLAERNRIAREVHDTLAQDLVSATLQLDLVMMQLNHRPLPDGRLDRAVMQLRSLRKFVGEGLAEARQSIAELRDGSVNLDLPSRVRGLALRNASIAEITRVVVDGPVRPLRPGVERETTRIVGEALSNAARHAQAKAIAVTLRYLPQQLKVVVHDDGRGFSLDTQAREEGHFGLQGMRERAETLGAELQVESSPGNGTTVTLVVLYGEGV